MTDQVGVFEQMIGDKKTASPDQGPKPTMGENAPQGFEDLLGGIKNERGEPKYKSVEDAITALQSSQEHIARIERENQELRQKTQEAMTLEQLKAQLNSTNNKTDDNQNSFSMEDIKNLVSETLQETEATKAARQNQQAVVTQLKDSFGEKAEDVYVSKAEELGLSVEELNSLAARSPKAVLQYFNASGPKGPSKTNQGSVNTEAQRFYEQQKPTPTGIMYGASTNQMIDAWRASIPTE